jgi:SAM-dependent methyltransferase
VGRGIHRSAAVGYERAPAAYERGRPGYPEEAVAVLAERLGLGPGATVLDLAAGTGKLTCALAATGADVVAVEPVAEMRAALTGVRALAGTAEEIPLEGGSVHAITVAQAFHWFRGEEALAEIHRVLRPRGGLGLVWNLRDESVPWVAELTRIMEPHRGDAPRAASGAWREAFERTVLFEPLEAATFRHVHELSVEGLVARVASVSFIAALPEPDRIRVLAEVRELADGSTVELPYRTEVYWTTRRADARP